MNLLAPTLGFVVKFAELYEVVVTTLIFVVIGLIFFGISFGILTLVTPFSIKKEIEEDQNTALGIVIGSMLIGIAIIIAAATIG
ncbi:MAG: DUF350 domain-containing protein [Pyrinomonadaceae bacterium]|nr:DUF350 domain-containing protein [Pyrinomonadaceae bacterium]